MSQIRRAYQLARETEVGDDGVRVTNHETASNARVPCQCELDWSNGVEKALPSSRKGFISLQGASCAHGARRYRIRTRATDKGAC